MFGPQDQEIIDYITKYGAALTSTIYEIFDYNTSRSCQRRLKKLVEYYKELKRDRDIMTNEYCFYIKKTTQFKHKLLLTNFHREMYKRYEIIFFDNEIIMDHLRADGMIVFKNKKTGHIYAALVEVQISNTKLDVDKYKKFYEEQLYKKHFGDNDFPMIIAITNQKIPKVDEFEISKINVDMSNIDDLFK